jgi:hypothetical protein
MRHGVRVKLVLVLAIVTAAASAHAQGGPPGLTPVTVPAEPQDDKSPATAFALSAGITGAGLGLAALGGHSENSTLSTAGALMFAIGPTTGHIYADDTLNTGLGIRTAGAVASFAGALTLASCGLDECEGGDATVGVALFYGGAVLFAAGGLYEIATAPSAATEHNRKHRVSISVVPQGRGIGLAGTF